MGQEDKTAIIRTNEICLNTGAVCDHPQRYFLSSKQNQTFRDLEMLQKFGQGQVHRLRFSFKIALPYGFFFISVTSTVNELRQHVLETLAFGCQD